ncbi:MAG TPA: anaerobic glycerol-3-phosphate dehydrogenase subunit A [Desulfobacteraceae bacterium]|nr:anaerobic glycerol-3-phosphate dehydrogenase subunit A [Desulfobacteraceae bacterium]
MKKVLETDVLIIGGGATGTGLARDLALRGLRVILAEKKDLNAGASGANHGLLHSGARYVHSDMEAAIECRKEGMILKQIAPQCIEETGGLFVAVPGDDEGYISGFPGMCRKANIHCRELTIEEALEKAPCIAKDAIAVYEVPDAAIDPFKLAIENMTQATGLGGTYLPHSQVTGFDIENGEISLANLRNNRTGNSFGIKARAYVSASGAWAGALAKMAGACIPMLFSKGSLLVTGQRLAVPVINRLRKASDADILVPGGVVSIIGTTSVRVDDPDRIFPSVDEVDLIIDQGRQMVPDLGVRRYIRAYCGVRPLVSADDGDDRNVTRGFALIDHEKDGVNNFVTITSGKLTTYRLMAEKTADLVCAKLGVEEPCRTGELPLPMAETGDWTEPAASLRHGFSLPDKKDRIICECEMVPASAIDAISADIRRNQGRPDLLSIGLRSRMGKGPCQGSTCSTRLLAHLYEKGEIRGQDGIKDIQRFLNERWKGEHSLLWGDSLAQSSLKEMIHCGVFGLERA